MKFYIYEDGEYKKVKVETLPSITDMLDETLDIVSFSLMANDKADAYLPTTKFKVEFEDDENTIKYFEISSDTVEIFRTNPPKYKHRLSCIQNTRKLSRHIVRDSNFTQPANKHRESLVAVSCGINLVIDGHSTLTRSYRSGMFGNYEPLVISNNEKISNTYVEIDVQVAKANGTNQKKATWLSNINGLQDINSQIQGELHFNSLSIYLFYELNGQQVERRVAISEIGGSLVFNKKLDAPFIKDIIEQGATNIRLGFEKTTDIPINSTPLPCYSIPFTYDCQPSLGNNLVFIMCQAKIIAETYYYTVYDVLDLLRKRQKQENINGSKNDLFKLPTEEQNPELYNLLKTTIAPNFTFTQLTLYECIADIFRLFDAIFTMDDDGVLGIKYFNERNNKEINPRFAGRLTAHSETKYTNGYITNYQDGRVELEFPAKGSYAHLRATTLGVPKEEDDKYFVVEQPIQFIESANVGGFTTIFSNGYTTDSTKSRVPQYQTINDVQATGEPPFDITRYIIEESLWGLLDKTSGIPTGNPSRLLQTNTITFQQYQNSIHFGSTYTDSTSITYINFVNMIACAGARMAGVDKIEAGTWSRGYSPQYHDPDVIPVIRPFRVYWKDIVVNLHYFSSSNGRVKVESITNKYDGESLIDQLNGAVDLNKMGLNMLGYALKNGEPSLSGKHIICDISKRIKKGDIYRYNNEIWVANSCLYTVMRDGKISGQITFTKNFNSLSLVTRKLNERRMTNISRDLVMKSEDNFIEYCYLSSISQSITSQTISINPNSLLFGIWATFKTTTNGRYAPTLAFMSKESVPPSTYNGNFSSGEIETTGEGYESVVTIELENASSYNITVSFDGTSAGSCSYTADDNSIVLICDAQDERDFDYTTYLITVNVPGSIYIPLVKYGAGNAVCFEMEYKDSINAGNQTVRKTGWFGTSDYYTDIVKYTDDNGFRETLDIYLYKGQQVFDRTFPEIDTSNLDSNDNVISIRQYKYYKQPNEIFALNYEIIFLAANPTNEFIGSKFIDNNALVNDDICNKKVYLSFDNSDDDKYYSVLDIKGKGRQQVEITSVTALGTSRLIFEHSSVDTSLLNQWALVDEDNNILFASNIASNDNNSKRIYIYTRRERI